MAKAVVQVRNLVFSDAMFDALYGYDNGSDQVAPGQVRLRDGWYYLTFLKVVKVKNFDLATLDLVETEVDCIRFVAFMIDGGKLFVRGGKADVREITELFDALALKLAGNSSAQTINYDDYYRLTSVEVDLCNVLKFYEKQGSVADVKKLTLKDMEVKAGSIKRAVIDTTDYGLVYKLLSAVDNSAVAVEILLREPEKTSLYVDLDGQVRVNCLGVGEDVDVEAMVLECGAML